MRERFNYWDSQLASVTIEKSEEIYKELSPTDPIDEIIKIIKKEFSTDIPFNEYGIGSLLIRIMLAFKFKYPLYYQELLELYEKQKQLWLSKI